MQGLSMIRDKLQCRNLLDLKTLSCKLTCPAQANESDERVPPLCTPEI